MACLSTLIREEARDVYSDRRSIQWITIMCIKRHVSLIEMCVIRRLSARKLVEPAISYFFLQRQMPSSMKAALSTNIMQLVSSIVIPFCVLQCILAFWLGSQAFWQDKVKKFPFQYMADQLTLAKQKTVIAFGESNLFHVVCAKYLNKAHMFINCISQSQVIEDICINLVHLEWGLHKLHTRLGSKHI